MSENNVTLLLPILNEVESLKVILPGIPREIFKEVLVVDGGSTDGSLEYLSEQKIRVIHQKRKGLAFGLIDAISEIDTKYVITFSPDGNCRIEDLQSIMKEIDNDYALIVVSRYLPPAKSYDDDIVTRFGNYIFTQMINFMGKNKITDSLNIYRAYKVELIKNMVMTQYIYGPVLEPLLSAFTNLNNMKYKEIPGDEPKRIFGERKMRIFYNGSCILLMVFRMYFLKIKKYFEKTL